MPLRGLENLGNQPKIAELVSGREKTILLLVPQTAMVLPSLHLGPPLPEYIPSLKTVVGTGWVLGTLYGRKEREREGGKSNEIPFLSNTDALPVTTKCPNSSQSFKTISNRISRMMAAPCTK